MLTRFKRFCCSWLPGIMNRSRAQFHDENGFFFLRSSFSSLPTASTLMRALDWTRETVKRSPRSLPRRPPEFSAILSRAARGFQAGAPAGRPATASSQPASLLMGTRSEAGVCVGKSKAVEFTGSRSSPGLTRQPALSSPTPAHLFSRDTMPTVQRKGTAHQQNVTAYQALV